MKRFVAILMAAAMLLTVLAGCSGSTKPADTTPAADSSTAAAETESAAPSASAITVVLSDVGNNMDPSVANAINTFTIMSHVYDNLLNCNLDFSLQPGVIASWEQPDELTYELTVGDGFMFQNGEPLEVDGEPVTGSTTFTPETADGKVAFLREVVALLAGIPNAVERDVYLSEVASELEVAKEAVETQLKFEQKRASKRRKRDASELKVYSEVKAPSQRQDFQRARNIKFALAEDKLLGILMKNPDYYAHAASRITLEDFVTDRNRELAKVIFERLAAGQSVELSLLSAQLTVDQMGVASELVNAVSGMMFGVEDVDSYIDTILSHKNIKSQDEVAAMTDDDLKAYIASLASKKKSN